MEQHAIPRNISSFQFHLIGDMTLRQFGYMAAGAITGYIVYRALPVPGPIAIGAAGICALIGFAFAFVPIQERPLDRWIVAFIKSILSPTQYVWHKIPTVPDILIKPSMIRVQKLPQAHQEAHHDAREKLDNYLHSLPQAPHQVLNLSEKRYVDSTMHLFSTTPNIPAAVFSANSPPTIPSAFTPHPVASPPAPPSSSATQSKPATIIPPAALSGGIPINQLRTSTAPSVFSPGTPTPSLSPNTPMAPISPSPVPVAIPPSSPPILHQTPVSIIPTPPTPSTPSLSAASLTPTPSPSSPTPPGLTPIPSSSNAHQSLVSPIIPSPTQPATHNSPTIVPPNPIASPKQVPADPVIAPAPHGPDLSSLQQQLDALMAEKTKMAEELTRLKQQKDTEPQIIKPIVDKEKPKKPTIKAVTAKAAVEEIGMPTLPQTPNVVIGIIKDGQKKILPNIILTIKDNKGMPLRALKTNKLGQFITATPLPNGTYFLEVEDPLKRYTFDVAEITMKGEIFLPIEITAKGEKEIIREKLAKELFGST